MQSMILKKRMLLVVLFLVPFMALAQAPTDVRQSGAAEEPVGTLPELPVFAAKTNLLYDATTTFNLGVEFRLSRRLSLDLPVNYNPWTFSNNRKLKHILVQPELRYWIYEPFNGHFLGVHALWSLFNVGNLSLPSPVEEMMGYGDLKNYRYEGNLYGVGVSYGYHWILSRRFSLEATLGLGYVYLDYDRFNCPKCGERIESETKHYFGPTKVGVSLIYMIK